MAECGASAPVVVGNLGFMLALEHLVVPFEAIVAGVMIL